MKRDPIAYPKVGDIWDTRGGYDYKVIHVSDDIVIYNTPWETYKCSKEKWLEKPFDCMSFVKNDRSIVRDFYVEVEKISISVRRIAASSEQEAVELAKLLPDSKEVTCDVSHIDDKTWKVRSDRFLKTRNKTSGRLYEASRGFKADLSKIILWPRVKDSTTTTGCNRSDMFVDLISNYEVFCGGRWIDLEIAIEREYVSLRRD